MRIIHAADIHLDSPMKGLRELPGIAREEVRLATRRAFIRLIDLCLEEQADLLLIAGDLFDQEQKDYNAGLFAVRQFTKLRDAGTAVVIVRGNHDAASSITRTLKETKNVEVTVLGHARPDTKEFPHLNIVVHGQSFPEVHVADNLALKLPARRDGWFNIGLLHADVGGVPNDPYAYAPCALADLLQRGYDYWALGHNHVRSDLYSGGPYIAYPGNLQGRHALETGPKGCLVVDADDGAISSVAFRSCDVVRWERVSVDVSSCRTLDDALDAVHRTLGNLRSACIPSDHPIIARVALCGESRVHEALRADSARLKAEIAAAAADWQVWPERVLVETKLLTNVTSSVPAGFLAALSAEFDRLGCDADALTSCLAELSALDQIGSAYRLEPKPTDPAYARGLLDEAANLVLARLRDGSLSSPA